MNRMMRRIWTSGSAWTASKRTFSMRLGGKEANIRWDRSIIAHQNAAKSDRASLSYGSRSGSKNLPVSASSHRPALSQRLPRAIEPLTSMPKRRSARMMATTVRKTEWRLMERAVSRPSRKIWMIRASGNSSTSREPSISDPPERSIQTLRSSRRHNHSNRCRKWAAGGCLGWLRTTGSISSNNASARLPRCGSVTPMMGGTSRRPKRASGSSNG